MVNICHNIDDAAKRYGMDGNYVAGANIAGFEKVVDAMTAQGIVQRGTETSTKNICGIQECRIGQKWLKSGIFMAKNTRKMFIALDINFCSSYNNITEIDASIRVC